MAESKVLNAFELAASRPRAVPDSRTPPKKRGPRTTHGTGLVLNGRGQLQATLAPNTRLNLNLVSGVDSRLAAERRKAMCLAGI